MNSAKRIIKYLVLMAFALLFASGIYVAGKTPRVIQSVLRQVKNELWTRHRIRLELGEISIDGFLTIAVQGFLLEKKDAGLFVQAKSIKAKLSPWRYFIDHNPVSKLEIDTPEVMVTIPPDSGPQRKIKFDFSLSQLVLKNARAEIRWKDKVFQILNLETQVKITPGQVNIYLLSVETPELKLLTDGKVGLSDPNFLGLHTALRVWFFGSLEKVPELRNLKIPLKGEVRLQGRLDYATVKRGWEFLGQTSIKDVLIDTVSIHSITGPVFANQKQVELRGVDVDFAGAKPRVSGVLKLDKELHFMGEVLGSKVSLHELLADLNVKDAWVEMELNTQATAHGQVFPEFFLQGRATGTALNLVVHDKKNLILKTAYPIQFEIDLGADSHDFKFRRAYFKDGKSKFKADCNLFLDDRKGMWLEAQFEQLNFDSIYNQIADGRYAGVGKGRVGIQGPYEHLKIEAPSQIKDFCFEDFQFGDVSGVFAFQDNQIDVTQIEAKQKSLEYEGDLTVYLNDDPVRIDLKANLKKGLAEDMRIFIFPALKDINWSGPIQGQVALRGHPQEGHWASLKGNLDLSLLPDSRLLGANIKSGIFKLESDASETKLVELHIESDQGDISGGGTYKKSNQIGIGHLKLEKTFLGNLDSNWSIEKENLRLQSVSSESKASLELAVDLKKALPFQLSLSMPYGPLSVLAPKISWLEEYQLQAGFSGEAKGLLMDLSNAEGSLELFPAVFYLGSLKLLATQKVEAQYGHRAFSISPAVFKSVYGDEIKLKNHGNFEEFELDLRAKGDLWSLTHLDERIEGAYGHVEADILVKGPWGYPKYSGFINISPKSYVSLREYPPGLKNLSGQIKLEGERANINLEAEADRGHLTLLGGADLHQGSFEDLRADLVQMPVYYGSFLNGVANGFLNLAGPFSEPTLSGQVRFSELLITKNLDPLELKTQRSKAKKQSVKFNVHLSADNSVRVESKSFNGELIGALNLVGNSNSPGLLGELNVLSGEVYFRNNYYRISKARANFDNPFRIVPYIDVEANSRISDYDVTVRAQCELTKPKLVFSSTPSLSQSDLLSLISFGITNRDNKDNFGVARSAGLEAISAYSGIGNKLLNVLPGGGIDELRLGTLYNQNGGVTSSVVLGMQVFKTMRLRFHSALVQNSFGNREKRLELERYISRRWRWRVIWNSEGVTNYGDAGADLWFRWDF